MSIIAIKPFADSSIDANTIVVNSPTLAEMTISIMQINCEISNIDIFCYLH